ncbi:hypothetical protein J1614_006615 [Plenodomus biglobosus]|nr:hypothetical protein J1614_006615 [Plenodomus biglobosus]
MGSVRNVRRINIGPATGKEKRGRASRPKPAPQNSVHKISKQPADPSKKPSKANKTQRAGTRMGASEDMPIHIPSDDEFGPHRSFDKETSMYTLSSWPSHQPSPCKTSVPSLQDCKGRFTSAKERLFQANSARHPTVPSSPYDTDQDDIMVKINPNDSFLEWDQDEPEDHRPHHHTAPHLHSKSHSRTHRNEYTPNPTPRPPHTSKPPTRPTAHINPHKPLPTKTPRHPSNAAPRSPQHTNPIRAFITTASEQSPTSSSDAGSGRSTASPGSTGSSAPGEGEPVVYLDAGDWDGDAQPRFACNAELLDLRRKGLGAFV